MLRRSKTSATSQVPLSSTTAHSHTQKLPESTLLTAATATAASKTQNPFLLPTADFFVTEQDTLLLSEVDIFQTASPFASAAAKAHEKENEPPRRGRPPAAAAANVNNTSININANPSHRTIAALQPVTPGLKRPAGKVPIAPQPPKMPHLTPRPTGPADASSNSSLFYASVAKATAASPRQSASAAFYGAVESAVNGVVSSSHLEKEAAARQADKGLRHFSAKVSAKVEEKGCTTYNEVADELVREFDMDLEKCDHKNIRRRVYDALNVLMAIDIIQKDKKEIRWLGLPNQTVDDLRVLEAEKAAIQQRIAEKTRSLREILRRVTN